MKLEQPAPCLFSSFSSGTCHPDDDDQHPYLESCNIHIHPQANQEDGSVPSSPSSGQLFSDRMTARCHQIIPNHEKVNENSRHQKSNTKPSAQNPCINHDNFVNYPSKRCHRSLSLPILLILVLSMPSVIYPVFGMDFRKGSALKKSEQLQQKDQLVEVEEDPESCRLEDSIPGTPGDDYPTYTDIPETGFKCSDKQFPGYYAGVEAECQVFHVCQADGRKDSFLCPVGTIFNQELFVCDWWNNFRCQDAATFSDLNSELYITPKIEFSRTPSSNLLQKRINKDNYELENNSLGSDEREREDSIESDEEKEVFEERITVTAAPIVARKGNLNQNLQTNSQLQQEEVKGKIQDIKGKQQKEIKGRQQEVKSNFKSQDVKTKLQKQEVKGKLQQEVKGKQEVKGRQEVKGTLKQQPVKSKEVKGNLQDERTSTTYGTRLSGRVKSAPLTASRTLVENSEDDWYDDIGSTDAITTPEATTAPTWTFEPTPTTSTTTARVVSAQVKQSRQELKSPAQLRNSVKFERLVGDGKEEFVYWDSRFDNRQQIKSQFQQQMLEQQRQIPIQQQQQQLQQEPVQQRQQLPQQLKSSRLVIEDRWTPMINADIKAAPLIQTTTTTARSTTRTTPVTSTSTSPVTTVTTTTITPTAARLQRKGGNVKTKSKKLIQTTTTEGPLVQKDKQQVNERFVYWDSRFGEQQQSQQEQGNLEQEQKSEQKGKTQQKQDRSGVKLQKKEKQETKQKFQQSSELVSAFEDEWTAIEKEAAKMKESLSSTPPSSTRTAKTTTARSTTTRVTTSLPVTSAPLLQSRNGKLQTKSNVKKSQPLRTLEADFDDQPMSAVCDWWHSPDCRDTSSSSSASASNEKDSLKEEEKQGYVAPMQIVSYRTSVNHDDRPSSTTTSWEKEEEEENEREREDDSLSVDEPEERVSVTLAPLTNSKRSERLQQQTAAKTNERIRDQSSKARKQSPVGQQRKVVSNFGGRLVTKAAQTKSQKKRKELTLEDGTPSTRRQTKVTIGPATLTTSSIPGESEAYTIFKTLKPRATSPGAPALATSTATSTSSVTISIRV